MEQSREQFIEDQRHLLLLKNSYTAILMSMFCVFPFIFLLWGTLNNVLIILWAVVFFLFAVARLIIMKKYKYVVGQKNKYLNFINLYGVPLSALIFSSIILCYINNPSLDFFYFFVMCSLAFINVACASYFIFTRVTLLYMFSMLIFPIFVFYIRDLPYFTPTITCAFLYILFTTINLYKIKRQSIERYGYMYDSTVAEQEKLISMSRLVVGVAHEINTPLGLTITYTSYMKDKVNGLSSKLKAKTMKKSDLENTIDVLLESHEESGKELNRVSELVQTFKLVVPYYEKNEIKPFHLKEFLEKNTIIHYDETEQLFDFAVTGDELEITTYPNAVEHVMDQLIQNSVKHGFKDGTREPKITVQIQKTPQEKIRLTYQDNGCGMGEKEIKYFFDPFYRGNVHLDNKGLGGHIIFNTVTQILKGTIQCGSQVNGCEFIIEFPLNISEYDSLALLYEI